MLPDVTLTIAGPGQAPARPHPTPKTIEPATSLMSTLFNFGQENSVPRNGFNGPLFAIKYCNGALILIAPPIIKANAGFQYLRSKKLMVADSFDMLLTAIAKANVIPKITSYTAEMTKFPYDVNRKGESLNINAITTIMMLTPIITPITPPDLSWGSVLLNEGK